MFSKSDKRFLKNGKKYIFIIINAFALFILLLSFFYERIGFSYHGNFHLSIVQQILNGFIPPENVCLAGIPINYPWVYHLILAVIHRISTINIVSITRIVATLSFVVFVLLVYKSNKKIFNKKLVIYLSTLLCVFGINIFASLFVIFNYPYGKSVFFDTPNEFLSLLTPLSNPRLATFYDKFINFSAYPIGIFLVSLYLFGLIVILKDEIDLKYSLICTISLLFAYFLHPFSALFITIVLIPSFSFASLFKGFDKKLIFFLILNFASFLTAFPYLISLTGVSPAIEFVPVKKTILDIFVSYPLHIIFLSYVFLLNAKHIKKYIIKVSNIEVFLITASVMTVFIVFLFNFSGGNDYKFIQLLSLVLSPLLVINLTNIVNTNKLKVVFYIVSALVLFKLSIIAVAYYHSDWAKEGSFDFNRNLYGNIADSTNSSDIILNKNDNFKDLRASYLTGRRNYAVNCPPHTNSYPSLEIRLRMMNDLIQNLQYIKSEFPGSDFIFFTYKDIQGLELIGKTSDDLNVYKIEGY